MKAFADDKITNKMTITWMSKFVIVRIENIVGKGENTGYQFELIKETVKWKHLELFSKQEISIRYFGHSRG